MHRISLRMYNPETPPENNYQEARWQMDDNIVVPQDDLYTLAWEREFGGHPFDIPIIYTDPNAIDFDESYTQGPDTVIVPRSYFHDRGTCPISDPFVSQSSKPESNGQNQGTKTTTDLTHNDHGEKIFQPSTDTETTREPMPQPPSRQSDNSSTLEINDPIIENILQTEPSLSRGGNDIIRPNPNPNYSELYRY